jgi:riboflavin synthase
MFTGLIEEVGAVSAVESSAGGSRITVAAHTILENVQLGDSIAVDGACMTVVAFDSQSFTFEASLESLSKTNLSTFKPGRGVNLEHPLTPISRIGGHYVTGHVDGMATLVSKEPQGNSIILTFEVDSRELAELFVPKGSVAVLGISLTVNTVEQNRFSVAIIPHTLTHTNLGDYQPGDRVNIETDLLGKYVRRLMFERGASQTEPSQSELDQSQADATDLISSYPSRLPLEGGGVIDAPSLVPAMNTLTRPGASISGPAGANIRTGSWFNHDPE